MRPDGVAVGSDHGTYCSSERRAVALVTAGQTWGHNVLGAHTPAQAVGDARAYMIVRPSSVPRYVRKQCVAMRVNANSAGCESPGQTPFLQVGGLLR